MSKMFLHVMPQLINNDYDLTSTIILHALLHIDIKNVKDNYQFVCLAELFKEMITYAKLYAKTEPLIEFAEHLYELSLEWGGTFENNSVQTAKTVALMELVNAYNKQGDTEKANYYMSKF
ncbi:MAG: hypothetical protein IJ250_04620 [Bacteroidales bacterium]|nr:hypothetical protein [Bacteroidales bacterium]